MEFFSLISTAYADGAAAAGAAADAPHPLLQFVPFVLMFGIFYFLLIRPQNKKMQKKQAYLQGLSKGDEVYTESGIVGMITGLTDQLITLEVSEGVKMKVLRASVSGPVTQLANNAANNADASAKAKDKK